MTPHRPGRPRSYTAAADQALRFIWETCDHSCGGRWQPFLPEMITVLARHGELVLPAPVPVWLCQMSDSPSDRHLAPARQQLPRRGLTYGYQTRHPAQAGQLATLAARVAIRNRLPFPLRGVASDNGAEFSNQQLYRYCEREQLVFTRSRPYRKHDPAHVAQTKYP